MRHTARDEYFVTHVTHDEAINAEFRRGRGRREPSVLKGTIGLIGEPGAFEWTGKNADRAAAVLRKPRCYCTRSIYSPIICYTVSSFSFIIYLFAIQAIINRDCLLLDYFLL